MANIPVKNEFKTEMVAFERTDKALADSFNEKYSQLLSNEYYLDSHKVEKVNGKALSTNDYTTDEKNKLAGIENGANKTVVDNAMSSSSTNPAQNKTVKAYVDDKTQNKAEKSDLGGCKFSVVDGNLIITYDDGTEE